MTTETKPKVLFWIIAVFFLLWNLIGVAFFFIESLAPEVMTAQMNEQQAAMYEQRPGWYIYNYGVAVFTAFAACIALLFKKKVAIWFALVSFLALFVSTSYHFSTGAWDIVEAGDKVTFLMVPAFGLLLFLFTRFAQKKAWLK